MINLGVKGKENLPVGIYAVYKDKAVKIKRIIISNGAENRIIIGREAQRVIKNMTEQHLPIKRSARITDDDLHGSLVIENHSKNNKAANYGYSVKLKNGGIVLTGTDAYYTFEGMFRFFKSLGVKFYVRKSFEKYRKNLKDVEVYPKKKAFIVDKGWSERPRFAHLDDDTNMGNPRTTKEKKNKVYGNMWGHTADLMVPFSIYGKSHPEYYALVGKGKRLFEGRKTHPSQGIHLCMSNNTATGIAAENIANWIDQQPEKTFFRAIQGDGPNWCRCANCKKIDLQKGNASDRLMAFNNKIATNIKNKYPEKKIVHLAYTPFSESAPEKYKPEDNIVVMFAPYCWGGSRSQWHPLNHPINNQSRQNFMDWVKLLQKDQMIIFEYPQVYPYYLYPTGALPADVEDIKFYAKYNQVFAILYCGVPRISFHHLYRYVIGELLWDPKLDKDKLIDDFMNSYYGEAAPYIREYFNLLNETVKGKPHFQRCEKYASGLFNDKLNQKAYNLLSKAEKTVSKDKNKLDRILTEKACLLFVDLTEKNIVNGKTKNPIAFAQKLQEFIRIMKETISPQHKKKVAKPFLIWGQTGLSAKDWLKNVSNLVSPHANIYSTEVVHNFLASVNPLKFIRDNSKKGTGIPFGEKVNLSYFNEVINFPPEGSKRASKEKRSEVSKDAPADHIWGARGNNKKKLRVTYLGVKGSSKDNIHGGEWIDNQHDTILRLQVLNESKNDLFCFQIKINGKLVHEKNISHDGKWHTVDLPLSKNSIKQGWNRIRFVNTSVKSKRLFIKEIKLLY